MPTYRIQPQRGDPQTVQALRLRTDDEHVYFEDRVQGHWRPILRLPLDEVERVQRRLNEDNGSWIWVTEHVRRMPL
ncbi:hypothetical protein [Actinomadura sp. 6K520]|uniref:hypothetical protein n=1 Tax=Actinomadura sp. 6K520 TaxID=2530364 RepID=UPI0010455D3A|nr:hypothetical protein [Actinomadura sp. 6K520]TDE26508.1 hypothetical protein E1289_25275 [Actinomadura sp. 6K520]